MRLRDGGLYAIPVRVDWNSKTSKKESKFPCTWGQIIDPKSWYESINTALLQRADANGVAILTGPSGLFAIDVDVDANFNPKKLPGIDLWNRLINIHGEPDTLRARTASGGLHYLFRSNSPGLSSQKNFATVKDGKYTYGIDARCWGGCIFAEPTSYVKEGQVVAYEWLNGPPSYEACKEIPGWLIDLMGNLLDWYEMQRKRRLGSLYGRHPDLQGFVVDGKLKPLDSSMANPKLIRTIKLATESCMKELDECMPSFGRVNVQDAADVRETSEELFVIMNGLSGANGKGVLKKAIDRAFGNYAGIGNKALFVKPTFKVNASAASTALMHIRPLRFAFTDELEKTDHLNDPFIKESTDGGHIEARELFCKTQSYVSQYKLCLFTNYRPGFPSDDAALIRRMVLITFEFTYKDAHELDIGNSKHKLMDTTLKPYFDSDEGAADTLDFCVEGATMFYAKKREAPTSKALSSIPEVFSAAAREYMNENDKLQMFIDQECTVGANYSIAKDDFVDRFANFLYARGYDASLAGEGLNRAMRMKGFSSTPSDGRKNRMIQRLNNRGRMSCFFGIRLLTEDELKAVSTEVGASEA
ncbi:hypothetical protein KFL_013760010 [Klebsormidium nitens]|uniref:DNA primase/polymerase bifunctional N-terminal domain-containing protein n=1 Tax=Klebsormidium nitens TaxID=105231 RepID=A0A1Y1IUE9_KLENI|nr:hypothetical protein KFL_013760010 [Klebsormidium nitens]|eukprot:GAQ93229.1 hypothetical protein KFL_013760010 [Klebsormidium nitens]